MSVRDFIIDLNDLWGRLVPGLLFVFWLYLLNARDPLSSFFTEHPPTSVLLVLPVLVAAYLLGELSLYPVFKLRNALQRSTAGEYVQLSDATANKALVRFYEARFSAEALRSRGWELFSHCKEFLLQAAPEAYNEARRMEARINLKGGVLIPLGVLAVLFALRAQWAPFAVASFLVAVFFLGFSESRRKEALFVYRAYYICHVLKGSS
jgi:hypothetical protein